MAVKLKVYTYKIPANDTRQARIRVRVEGHGSRTVAWDFGSVEPHITAIRDVVGIDPGVIVPVGLTPTGHRFHVYVENDWKWSGSAR